MALVTRPDTRTSVTSICEAAGVARSTFSTHFATVDELAPAALGAALTAAVADDTERRAAHELDRVTITQLGAIACASRDALEPRLVARAAESVGQVIFTEHPEFAEADARLHANFIAAGTV